MKPIEFSTLCTGQVIRSPKGYWAFIPAPLLPKNNWSPGLVSITGEAERKLAELAWIGQNFPKPHTMLQRNLLYTASQHAHKLCVLAGSPRAISMAVRNNKVAHRFTALEWRLAENKRRKSGDYQGFTQSILLQQLAVYGIINV